MYIYMPCTYRSIRVHNFIYMYIHVCTMYRALCTYLKILVHVVRIPEAEIEFGQSGWLARRRGSEKLHWKRGSFALLGLRKLEPVRERLPLDADSSRFEIQK
jgi:hypothetical protein